MCSVTNVAVANLKSLPKKPESSLVELHSDYFFDYVPPFFEVKGVVARKTEVLQQ